MISVLTVAGVIVSAGVLLLLAFESEEETGHRAAHVFAESIALSLAGVEVSEVNTALLRDLLIVESASVDLGEDELGQLSYIGVLDDRARPIASTDAERPITRNEIAPARQAAAEDGSTVVESLPAGFYAGTAPIRAGDGSVVGTVRVEFESSNVRTHFETYRWEYLIGVVVLLVALVSGSWFMARRLARPIGLMVEAAHAVEDGKQPPPAVAAALRNTSLGRDEYGELSGVFLDMAREVGQREVQLNTLVEERTAELSEKNRLLEDAQREIRNDLEMAHSVQAALVPSDLPEDPRAGVAAYMTPALDVGGDFYDAFMTEDGRLAFAIADVSGKGVASALMMAVGRSLLRSAANLYSDPSNAVASTNDQLCTMNPKELFITCFFGVIDLDLGTLTYVNAGHDPPYLIRSAGDAPEMIPMTGGIALGVLPDLTYVETTIPLDAGNALYLYTDGVTEAENSSGQQYGRERLERQLLERAQVEPQQLMNGILDDVREFAGGAKQFDDLTCMAVQFVGGLVEESYIPGRDDTHLASGWRRMVVQPQLETSLPRVTAFVERFAAAQEIDDAAVYRINLALDELLTNTIEHGFPGRPQDADISVAIRREGEMVVVRYEDNGPPFDTLQAVEQDTELGLEERPIGGLGLQLIAATFEGSRYERLEERNVTTLTQRRQAVTDEVD